MKISILMCAKNSMPYIMASVNSFLKQNYKNKELIIIYSKSKDSTEEYINSINHSNIKKFSFDGRIYKALNFGIKKSKGDLVGLLHSDDVFFGKNTLETIAQEYKKSKSEIIFGNIVYSEKNNILKIVRMWDGIKINKKFDLPPHTGTFISKKILEKEKYKNNFDISADTELLLRIFNKKIKYSYINKFVTIMRVGGLSTNLFFLLKKMSEDLKIFKKYNLNVFDYIQKIFSKLKQLINSKKIKITKYHKEINDSSKVKFLKSKEINKVEGKIISALNLAFITYNYKFNLRSHNYLFWPDGIFSKHVGNIQKIPGRIYFKKIIKILNSHKKKIRNVFIVGNLPHKSKNWIDKNLKVSYKHKKLSYGNIRILKKEIYRMKFSNNSIIILTLPTPKQEIIANSIIKKYPKINIICIGGSINILSGHEIKTPTFFYKFNLEWLWRLKFDTRRRVIRLLESGFLYLRLRLSGDNNIY